MGGSSTLAADPNYRRVVELAAVAHPSAGTWSSEAVGSGSWRPRTSARTSPTARTRSATTRCDALAATPGHAADPAGYMGVADGIRERFAPGGESLAIPDVGVRG